MNVDGFVVLWSFDIRHSLGTGHWDLGWSPRHHAFPHLGLLHLLLGRLPGLPSRPQTQSVDERLVDAGFVHILRLVEYRVSAAALPQLGHRLPQGRLGGT